MPFLTIVVGSCVLNISGIECKNGLLVTYCRTWVQPVWFTIDVLIVNVVFDFMSLFLLFGTSSGGVRSLTFPGILARRLGIFVIVDFNTLLDTELLVDLFHVVLA